jgi:hypothetical protein
MHDSRFLSLLKSWGHWGHGAIINKTGRLRGEIPDFLGLVWGQLKKLEPLWPQF